MAVTVAVGKLKLLLINVYMPNDDGTNDKYEEFTSELHKIQFILETYHPFLPVIDGDINVDFSRDSRRAQFITKFMSQLNFCSIGLDARYNIDYAYNFCMTRFSTIDHFVMMKSHLDIVNDVYVDHDPVNLSDHDPLFMKMRVSVATVNLTCRKFNHRLAWYKATTEGLSKYKQELTNQLHSVHLPIEALLCNDLNCVNSNHREALNDYCCNISKSCLVASITAIPAIKKNSS